MHGPDRREARGLANARLAEQLGRILVRDATFAVPEPVQLS
jgi:hypothetical protein